VGEVPLDICNPDEPCGWEDVCLDWESRLLAQGLGSDFDCYGQADLELTSAELADAPEVFYDAGGYGIDGYHLPYEVVVTNLGDRTSLQTTLQVSVNYALNDTVDVPTLGPGESVVLELWTSFEVDIFESFRRQRLSFLLDPDSAVDDADTTNHRLTQDWTSSNWLPNLVIDDAVVTSVDGGYEVSFSATNVGPVSGSTLTRATIASIGGSASWLGFVSALDSFETESFTAQFSAGCGLWSRTIEVDSSDWEDEGGEDDNTLIVYGFTSCSG
jgi:hypothetical protein